MIRGTVRVNLPGVGLRTTDILRVLIAKVFGEATGDDWRGARGYLDLGKFSLTIEARFSGGSSTFPSGELQTLTSYHRLTYRTIPRERTGR